jgi:hypothetical protein
MESKSTCLRCGCEILERTARKTGGYCRICENYEEKELASERLREFQQWARMPMTAAEYDAGLQIDDLEELIGWFYEKASWRHIEASLSEGETLVLSIEDFLGQMFNGGVYQYLTNDPGALAGQLGMSFRRLGFHEWSHLADEVATFFPTGVPACGRERFAQLEQIDWQKVADIDSRFSALWDTEGCTIDECRSRLRDYIAQNRSQFIHA